MDVLVEEKGFRLVSGSQGAKRSAFAEDVLAGLSAQTKTLSARYLYDDEGSRLFEAICEVPEYYLTRVEASILHACASELVERMGPQPELVELGSGSAEKTRILLRSFLSAHGHLNFIPIDIADEMLTLSSRTLLDDFQGLSIRAIAGDYVDGLRELGRSDQDARARPRRLVLWLGSSIGNLSRSEAAEFLGSVHDVLGPDDALLIGIDHRKGRAQLEAAYDDAQGVTARFNKNLLVRINRELGGHFDPSAFDYRATYDKVDGSVNMHLVCREACSVAIDSLKVTVGFAEGESIHTESSHKYSRAEIDDLAERSRFRVDRSWSDEKDRFSLNLFVS